MKIKYDNDNRIYLIKSGHRISELLDIKNLECSLNVKNPRFYQKYILENFQFSNSTQLNLDKFEG